jgi:hypothetical protein
VEAGVLIDAGVLVMTAGGDISMHLIDVAHGGKI